MRPSGKKLFKGEMEEKLEGQLMEWTTKMGSFYSTNQEVLFLSPQESDESLMEELHEAYKQWLPLCREENNSKEVFLQPPFIILYQKKTALKTSLVTLVDFAKKSSGKECVQWRQQPKRSDKM